MPKTKTTARDDAWLIYYRGAMLGLISLVMAMGAWQSNRIITRQDEMATQLGELREDVSVEQTRLINVQGDVAAAKADVAKQDVRLSRNNDRQIEMGNEIAVMKSQLEDLRAKLK